MNEHGIVTRMDAIRFQRLRTEMKRLQKLVAELRLDLQILEAENRKLRRAAAITRSPGQVKRRKRNKSSSPGGRAL